MKYVELKNITKIFDKKTVIDNVSLEINCGDFIVLQGENGSGKSTLIKIIIGLLKANSGTVKLFDEPPSKPSAKKQVGVVLQSVNVPEKITVKELIGLFCSYYNNSFTIEEIIKLVNLQSKQDDYAHNLSGGQKQRLYFALALAGNPDLLILDEPTRNLDRSGCEDFWQQVKKCRDRGITILMVTNNQSDWQELDNLATRIITLENGCIVGERTIEANAIDNQKIAKNFTTTQPILKMLGNQIKFELLQWYRDIMPIFYLILFSGLIAYYIPLDTEYSKTILLVFAGINCLTFAIDKVGSRIAAERIEGWENLLRITPLSPVVYLFSKIFVPSIAMVINLLVIIGLSAIKSLPQININECFSIFLSLALGIIPFLIIGVTLGYLVKPKVFGIINGLSVLVAVFTSGIFPLKIAILSYLLIFSPFYHYSQLVISSANLGNSYNWMLNIFWLIWICSIFSFIAVWAYQREKTIQS